MIWFDPLAGNAFAHSSNSFAHIPWWPLVTYDIWRSRSTVAEGQQLTRAAARVAWRTALPVLPRPRAARRAAPPRRMALHDAYAWLRDYVTAIKAGQLHPFTHVERLAREATRRDPWGPTGLQLAELADVTAHPDHCRVVLAVLCYRLTRRAEKWRNVYKVRARGTGRGCQFLGQGQGEMGCG